METPRQSKNHLSKNLMQMKFMQRSAMRVQKDELEADQRKYIDDEHWHLDIPELTQKMTKYVIEPSQANCMELRFGRISYKGFNPDIEKLMLAQDTESELSRAEQREKEISVGDEEMAERYSSLVGTIGKKFAKKRQKNDDEEDDEEEDRDDVPRSHKTIKKDNRQSNTDSHKQKPRGKGGRYFGGKKKQ